MDEILAGMSALYQEMELAVANNPKTADRSLAKTLLTWIAYARRRLALEELSQALSSEYPEFLDLKRTIQDVCGQFVIVDRSSIVVMVHQTARDYLTKTPSLQTLIDENVSHGTLFVKTVSLLHSPELRSRLARDQQAIRLNEPFLLYAATSFMYHLRKSATSSKDMMNELAKFLRGPSVFTWVNLLALFSHLELLVDAAQILTWFAGLNRKLNIGKNLLLHRVQDLGLFELWAIGLVKVVAKFGRHLLDDPTAIYQIVPPLCPQTSIISRQSRQSELSALTISGISNST